MLVVTNMLQCLRLVALKRAQGLYMSIVVF